ncbi:MAG: GIY-YIG nuclease family protein [Tannerella sp.]|jgi:putative endonuclease|nr:GIY-YIG nuclease family protein [Tannerella sp.]
MQRGGAVYILTNRRNGTLYTGVTDNLRRRTEEHRTHLYPDSFTAKYDCHMLVYYCVYPRIEDAIAEEKRIKGGSRKAKIRLIENLNPAWNDLWDEIRDWD